MIDKDRYNFIARSRVPQLLVIKNNQHRGWWSARDDIIQSSQKATITSFKYYCCGIQYL